ncbi:MAG: nucleoside phosphorylase [Anaerolineales bacterium]|nr:nucleoside phosphorylase [Anaerolineales bacterium]
MTLNKTSLHTITKVQYATRLTKDMVGTYALLPGDPDRVLRISKYLDDAREMANCREFFTMTGTYKGIRVTATSTGVGCPSAAIATEELANVGVTDFIRVGSTAAIQSFIQTGDIIINTGTYRNDGTSRMYVPDNYPAVADHFLAHELILSARELQQTQSFGLHIGLNTCNDAFYAETPELIEKCSKLGLLNFEMESSAIFTVARLRNCRAAMVCGVSGNLVAADYDYDKGEKGNSKLVNAWETAIQIALEAVVRMEQSKHTK